MAERDRLTAALILAGFVVVTFAAAALGTVAALGARTFYASLRLPAFAPPPWLFGPVWTVLYLLIAVSGFLVATAGAGRKARLPLALWTTQLVLNAVWTWLFFAWRSGSAASVDIVVLFVVVAALMALSWRIRPLAALLLAPYLLWVGFAAALTLTVWILNPGTL